MDLDRVNHVCHTLPQLQVHRLNTVESHIQHDAHLICLERIITVTSKDCVAAFAPFLANAVCCPQLDATLTILIGQSSKKTSLLSLNENLAAECLDDLVHILVSQGANGSLQAICSINSSNLTEGSCPITDVEFERIVNSSNLLAICRKLSVDEGCKEMCRDAILSASGRLTLKSRNSSVLYDHLTMLNDCKIIVRRWLGSKLEPYQSNDIFRRLSTCKINEACLLNLSNIDHVIEGCGITGD